jgi:hypothetical protein
MKFSKCTREDDRLRPNSVGAQNEVCTWGNRSKMAPFPSVLARVRMQNRQQVAIPPLNKHGRWAALYTFPAGYITCKRGAFPGGIDFERGLFWAYN